TQSVRQGQGRLSAEPAQSAMPDSVVQAFQSLVPNEDIEEQKSLLPRPEELPPLEERNNSVHATIWLSAILICLLLLVVLSRGLSSPSFLMPLSLFRHERPQCLWSNDRSGHRASRLLP